MPTRYAGRRPTEPRRLRKGEAIGSSRIGASSIRRFPRGRSDFLDIRILILRALSFQHEIPFSLRHRESSSVQFWIFVATLPFADGMISVVMHFLLRKYCLEIRTLLDGVIAVNGDNVSVSESAKG